MRVVAYHADAGWWHEKAFRYGAAAFEKTGRYDLTLRCIASDDLAKDDLAAKLAALPAGSVTRLEVWGHAGPGSPKIAKQAFDTKSLKAWCAKVKPCLAPNALLWWRGCSTFHGINGKLFAKTCAAELGCRVAGHTYITWLVQSGLHVVAPGQEPDWPDAEGGDVYSWPWSPGGDWVSILGRGPE